MNQHNIINVVIRIESRIDNGSCNCENQQSQTMQLLLPHYGNEVARLLSLIGSHIRVYQVVFRYVRAFTNQVYYSKIRYIRYVRAFKNQAKIQNSKIWYII
jgi:hypothetical protein